MLRSPARLAATPGIGPVIVGLVMAVLVIAALLPEVRPIILVSLGGMALVCPAGSSPRWAACAGLPVAAILVWGGVAGDHARTDLVDCGNLLAPAAVARVVEAVVVIGLIVLLTRWLGVGLPSLGLRRPTREEATLGGLALAVIPAASLLLGSQLATPFFGPIRLDLGQPAAIVPALALAVANATMEESAYRGALLSWTSRAASPFLALLGQAFVFGAAHGGTDYVGEAWPVLLTVAAGGLLAGVVVWRTGSLWLPIVVHIGLDVPLYYAAVCRLPATAGG